MKKYMEEYVQKYLLMLLLVVWSISLFSLWTNEVAIRQGVNIEWFRSGTNTDDGCAIYVWSDTKLGARDLFAQKVDASGNLVWGQPLLVDGKPDRQEDPVITKTSDGNVIIAWIDFSNDLDGNVYAQKVNMAGQLMWQTGGVPLCVYPGIQISLNIEPDNSGGAYIVWEDSRNPSKDIYGQHISSTGQPLWAVNGIPIANGAEDESYNTMWADGVGGMIIGYVRVSGTNEKLFVKRFNPDGQMAWAAPVALSSNPAKQNKIKMSPINNDSFVFTWMDHRGSEPDIYAQRVDLSGTLLWADPTVVFSDENATVPAQQENPRIVQASDNSVIIIWEDKRNLDEADLFAQKLNLSGQRLWDVNGVALSIAEFAQRGPRMVSDGNGGCVVVWDDSRNGNAPHIDIFAQHISSTGTMLWEPNGKAICTSINEQSGSLIKKAGNNLFINWMDMRNGSVGIYYQVLNQSGVAQFTENGIQVFWGLSGDAQLKQVQVLPRQNDALVVWQDTRFANLGYQIFFQAIDSNSDVLWEDDGRAVTTLTGYDQDKHDFVVLPDDKFVVVWEENRETNPRVYAQLIDAQGNRLWGNEGITITNGQTIRQKDPKVSYSNGSIIVGWSNLVNVNTPMGTQQIYYINGQKLDLSGNRLWGDNGVLVSHFAPQNQLNECQLEAVVDRYFVWTKTNVDSDSEFYLTFNVWAKRVNDSNGLAADGWSEYGVATSNYANYEDLKQYLPKAALTTDGLFVEWLDFRIDNTKTLYGQMISPTSQILWNPSGVAMADYGREQDDFALVGGEDITFMWKESVTGSNQDLAIQKYALNATPLWGPLGSFVIQRDSTQSSPALAKFSDGKYLTVWEDFYAEDSDIFMKVIDSDGTIPTGIGDLVCDEIKIQQYPHIAMVVNNGVSTVTNKAFIIWSDGRPSGKTPIYGIYAQMFERLITSNDDNLAVNMAKLHQNYPNPFNPETKISFDLKSKTKVSLEIYNLKGQKIRTLLNDNLTKGSHYAIWDGKDNQGLDSASGVYIYRIKAGDYTQSKKMILMK